MLGHPIRTLDAPPSYEVLRAKLPVLEASLRVQALQALADNYRRFRNNTKVSCIHLKLAIVLSLQNPQALPDDLVHEIAADIASYETDDDHLKHNLFCCANQLRNVLPSHPAMARVYFIHLERGKKTKRGRRRA